MHFYLLFWPNLIENPFFNLIIWLQDFKTKHLNRDGHENLGFAVGVRGRQLGTDDGRVGRSLADSSNWMTFDGSLSDPK